MQRRRSVYDATEPMCNMHNAACSHVTTMYAARSNGTMCEMQQAHGIAGSVAAALMAENAIKRST
jgi:hypothetical protein